MHGLIGVLHLPALPGDPANDGMSFAQVRDFVLRDATALATGGVDAVILENFGSAPFVKGCKGDRVPPHQAAMLSLLAGEVKQLHGLPTGMNCLRNDAHTALGIAAAAELDFIRVNVHTGTYVTDQGVIEGEAAHTLRYRKALGVDHGANRVSILADVLVKHASPLAPLSAQDAVKDTLLRGLADAVIVTGAATGAPVDEVLLSEVREAAGDSGLVLLGSGLSPDNATLLAPHANGAIVGTWPKEEGRVHNAVDATRVRKMAEAVRGLWRVNEASKR